MKQRSILKRITDRITGLPGRLASQPAVHLYARNFLDLMRPRRVPASSLQEASRILIIKPDEIGDVVLVTGFLTSIRKQFPNAHVTLMVRRACLELVAGLEHADVTLTLPEQWRGTHLKARTIVGICRAARSQWSLDPPDWVLVPRSGSDTTGTKYYVWWSGAPRSCVHQAFCEDHRFNARPFFSDIVPQSTNPQHEIEYHRSMLRWLNISDDNTQPSLSPTSAAIAEGEAFLSQSLLNHHPLISIGLGAGARNRIWPLDRFIEVARRIVNLQPEVLIIVIGGPEDTESARTFHSALERSVLNAVGQVSLGGAVALMSKCVLHLGNDSGPMHVASTLGVPTVVISKHPLTGSGWSCHSPIRFGPLVARKRIIQPLPLTSECSNGCHHVEPHCILNVSSESVFAAVKELVDELPENAACYN